MGDVGGLENVKLINSATVIINPNCKFAEFLDFLKTNLMRLLSFLLLIPEYYELLYSITFK
jgi:hypothetical protein